MKLLNYSCLLGIMLFSLACGNAHQTSESTQKALDYLAEQEAESNNKNEQENAGTNKVNYQDASTLPRITQKTARQILEKFGEANPETLVEIQTNLGNMKIRLYEGTPLHRANFLQLAKRGFYEGTVFHRVVKDMIIQGGNLDDLMLKKRKQNVGSYRVPAEMKPQQFFHKKGAIASPRIDENNPQKRSNAFEFYIVQGSKHSPAQVQGIAQISKLQYLPAQVQTYQNLGGLPHLDGHYTVFGEVVEGLEIVDKIAGVEVDPSDNWPRKDVVIKAVKVLE